MNNNKLILLGTIIVLIVGGVIFINVNVTTDPVTTLPSTTKPDSLTQQSSANKTDAEVMLEGAQLAKETYNELHQNKLRNDSIWEASRKRIWVYQIGLPMTNDKKLLEAYNSLKDFSNIKIFKSGKKSYFIYKDDGYSEQQLRDSLQSLQARLTGLETRIEVVDLMSLFSKREEVVRDDVKIKKEDAELVCYTCN